MLTYNKRLKTKARELRAKLTLSERALWSRLRGKQILGVQFYRQKPIGDFIVDFYAPKGSLVIELDGLSTRRLNILRKTKSAISF